MNDDPFAGIETITDLPPKPTEDFMAEINKRSDVQPPSDSLIRGLKKQSIAAFVKYLKTELPGDVDASLEVTLRPITYSELDQVAGRFLER